eukprot:CAMPEP_0196996624 /NCGR_PEP_ID=MMETSP1380-20130617/2451_1 /TAXON_ID=5936 /ORGANISM="Euplotes crassus, Strain CT5" /LENGTH=276 /DNA_ID=CAMNT_0042412651 /DNA_START=1384 /DNA_END=2214 /DNA_ORIENTATION=-
MHELMVSKNISFCEEKLNKYYSDFVDGDQDENLKSRLEMLKDDNDICKRKSKLSSPDFFHIIFGEQEKQRIFISIKLIVRDYGLKHILDRIDSDDSDYDSLSDDNEESKFESNYKCKFYKKPVLLSDALLSTEEKEKIALFYIHLVSIDKEIISLLNEIDNNWKTSEQEYIHADHVIARDNVTARIPEHLDEEDKKKFELIKQHSVFPNEQFYEKYVKEDEQEIIKRESSDINGKQEGLLDIDLDLDDDSYADEFDDDDLDSLLLSTSSIPQLERS